MALVPMGNQLIDFSRKNVQGSGGVQTSNTCSEGNTILRTSGNYAFRGLMQNPLRFSIMAVIRPTSITAEGCIAQSSAAVTTGAAQFSILSSEINLISGNEFIVATSSGSGIAVGKTSTVILTFNEGGGTHSTTFYCDGRKLDTDTGAAPTFVADGSGIVFVKQSGSDPFTGGVALLVDFIDILSDDQAIALSSNPWQIFAAEEDEEMNVDTGVSAVLFDLLSAIFNKDPSPVQNVQTTSHTAATLNQDGGSVQNRSTTSHAAATMASWLAKTIQMTQITSHTAALLNWSAQAVDFVIGGAAVVFDLLAATFTKAAQSVQNSLTTSHTAATQSFVGQGLQSLQTTAHNAATWAALSAKTIQNRLTTAHTAAQITLTGLAISARLTVSLTAATWASWLAKTIQMVQTTSHTAATFRFVANTVEITTDAIVSGFRRGVLRMSRYRQLLKQRRY